MLGIIGPLLSAISAALSVWKSERALYNNPAMAKNQLQLAQQNAVDALNTANATLSNPSSTPQQHADALRALRLADS